MSTKGLQGRKQWLLLVITAAKGKSLTPVQLQKCMFLLGQEHSIQVGSEYYEFVPYDYGPFSLEVYQDADDLAKEGYILIEISNVGRWKEYTPTIYGTAQAEILRGHIGENLVKYIEDTVTWARSLSFQQLVKAIYQRYPTFRERSIFQD